jgi:DNA-binding transcriptional LysR family regulator
MHSVHLSSIDLNLLVVLDAVLETHSVSAAAARLALSPSATSHALARLRELLGDPVLVRAGRAMVPTTRAERIRPRLAALLDDLRAVLQLEGELDPATLSRGFRIGATDYAELLVVSRLSDALAEAAPGVDLYSSALTATALDPLRSAELDLAIGVFLDLPDDVCREALFHERFVCVMRRGHSGLRGRMTAKRYAEMQHVLVSPRGGPRGIVDAVLERSGLHRRVARTVANFLVAPHLIARCDYVLTIPARIAAAMPLALAVREPPIELAGFDLTMAWHRRHDVDPTHTWLRARVRDIAARIN